MKKLYLLLIPALMFAAPAFGQMEAGMGMMMVGVGAGYALPVGDFSDDFDGSFIVGLNGDYMFTGMYGIEVGVDWAKFPGTEDTFDGFDINWQYIPVTLDLVATFPAATVNPYVKAGVGYYFGKFVGDDVPSDVESANDFGVNGGAGVKIPFGATTMFDLGVTYHYVFSEVDEEEAATEAGLPYNASFIAFKVGVGMKF